MRRPCAPASTHACSTTLLHPATARTGRSFRTPSPSLRWSKKRASDPPRLQITCTTRPSSVAFAPSGSARRRPASTGSAPEGTGCSCAPRRPGCWPMSQQLRLPALNEMSAALDWLIIGSGIHGVHIAARLLGESGVAPERLRIVDPGDRLLAHWCSRAVHDGDDPPALTGSPSPGPRPLLAPALRGQTQEAQAPQDRAVRPAQRPACPGPLQCALRPGGGDLRARQPPHPGSGHEVLGRATRAASMRQLSSRRETGRRTTSYWSSARARGSPARKDKGADPGHALSSTYSLERMRERGSWTGIRVKTRLASY